MAWLVKANPADFGFGQNRVIGVIEEALHAGQKVERRAHTGVQQSSVFCHRVSMKTFLRSATSLPGNNVANLTRREILPTCSGEEPEE